ncbi:hypothetical protein TRVA0_009S01046 [Trichomonascus vanleenenianus]|uniref:uncharacterized protein n=1 Tax=Trichomonascus vanleenenianus TaxID=2268995 RepID=UPI003EC97966
MNKRSSKGSVIHQPELSKTMSRSNVYELAKPSRSVHDLSKTVSRSSTFELSKTLSRSGTYELPKGEVSMSRTNLHEFKPVLAPFATGANYSTASLVNNNNAAAPASGYTTPSKPPRGSTGMTGLNRELYTSSVFNRYLNNVERTQSAYSLPSDNNAPINPRVATPRSAKSADSRISEVSEVSRVSQVPPIAVNDEYGSPVSTEIEDGDEEEVTQDTVDRLKNSLAYDVVLRLNTAETGLESRIDEFDRSLQELDDLRSRSMSLVDKFEAYSHRTKEEVESQLANIKSIRSEFAKVDEYERRVNNARKRVDEFKTRLVQINNRISEQESDNRKRKMRIKYAKRGSLLGTLLLVLLIFLIRTYFFTHHDTNTRQLDFDELIECLNNIDRCPY